MSLRGVVGALILALVLGGCGPSDASDAGSVRGGSGELGAPAAGEAGDVGEAGAMPGTEGVGEAGAMPGTDDVGEAAERVAAADVPARGRPAAPPGSAAPSQEARDSAVFAGGCFWCMEPPYDALAGVLTTTSGYAGGHVADPTYEQVTAGGTGHREAVRIVYDPSEVSYERLLAVFWRNVDPLDGGGQFCDRGFSYTTAIFADGPEQVRAARASAARIEEDLEEEVATPVVIEWQFYPAEDYHQDYYEKNPVRYKFYRWSCGRDGRLEELWGEG